MNTTLIKDLLLQKSDSIVTVMALVVNIGEHFNNMQTNIHDWKLNKQLFHVLD